MLIIEGGDCLGKTRLIPTMETLIRSEYRRRKLTTACPLVTKKYGMEQVGFGMAEWIAEVRPWVLCDRFALSGMVYDECSGRTGGMTWDEYHQVDHEVLAIGGMMLLVTATPERYEELLRDVYPTRGEAFSQDVCRAVNARYRVLAADWVADVQIELGIGDGWATDKAPRELSKLASDYVDHQLKWLSMEVKKELFFQLDEQEKKGPFGD